MRPLLALLFLLSITTAMATDDDDVPRRRLPTKPKNWDLHLLAPGCNPDSPNWDISLYHAKGIKERGCESLEGREDLDLSKVDTLSWKSPSSPRFDLCLFMDPGCDGAKGWDTVRGAWSVCYKWVWGWRGYRVVPEGGSCVGNN